MTKLTLFAKICLSILLVLSVLLVDVMLVSAQSPETQPGAESDRGVATIGTVVALYGPTLILKQESLQFVPGKEVEVRSSTHHLAIGHEGNRLQVVINADTQVYIGGERIPLVALKPGTRVIVGGKNLGNQLEASIVVDLDSIVAPPAGFQNPVGESTEDMLPMAAEMQSTLGTKSVQDLSLCMGQDMDYDEYPNVRDFQGCWGGPSAADTINIPDIPLACPLVGCFVLDKYSYVAALGGWGFAFPFDFSSTSSGLTYHVPGSISLDIQPLQATVDDLTFWGGLGIDFGVNIDFCSLPGCFDVGTFWLGLIPSMLHSATEAAPLTGQTLDISEVACPELGGISIPDTPISLLGVVLCEDLALEGDSFDADVRAVGNTTLNSGSYSFDGPPETLNVRPDSLSVDVIYDEFWWVPDISAGLYFKLCALQCNWEILRTPTIPLASGPFFAITTPFPYPGSLMTVATDPLSPIGDLWYLYQPANVTLNLPVDPAPTRLTIISSSTLAEGEPVQALLQEDYDGTPISGEMVIFEAGSMSVSAVTDASGVAQVMLPIGEYTLLASFGGSAYYLPSSDSQGPLYVYRPTNFVIWGGNAEGVQVDQQYQFWGSQWWKQVTGGDFDADASFKGYAEQVSDTTWSSPPANAVRPPETLPSYIGVIVTTQMDMHGRNVTGNIDRLVVLMVEDPSDYRPNPGHAAWGVMKTEITSDGILRSGLPRWWSPMIR